MKRSNMRWAKFAAGAAAGLGMLASPALASEIQSISIDPIGTLVPGHTGVTITGKVVCDVTGSVDFVVVTVTQTSRKTQFGFAGAGPHAAIPCGPFVTSWVATPTIDFAHSALLHKGKAGVQVFFIDGLDVHMQSAFVFLQ